MNKKNVAERMLFGADPYASKTHIQKYGGYTPTIAKEIFNKCKKIDNENIDIDIRPGHVLKATYFRVVGINMNNEIRRLKESKKYKEETK